MPKLGVAQQVRNQQTTRQSACVSWCFRVTNVGQNRTKRRKTQHEKAPSDALPASSSAPSRFRWFKWVVWSPSTWETKYLYWFMLVYTCPFLTHSYVYKFLCISVLHTYIDNVYTYWSLLLHIPILLVIRCDKIHHAPSRCSMTFHDPPAYALRKGEFRHGPAAPGRARRAPPLEVSQMGEE